MSYKSRLAEEKAKAFETKSQWNESVTSSKRGNSTEDKLAQKIAQEVLRDNAKLRGIHSGASIKHILEKEAKRQLQLEKVSIHEPKVAIHNTKGGKELEASNLPYLHKNPAI